MVCRPNDTGLALVCVLFVVCGATCKGNPDCIPCPYCWLFIHHKTHHVPGLLSIPWYTDDEYDELIFKNTVQFVLSHEDPYYYEGRQAKGLGSSHTRGNYVWPIGLTSQGLLPRLNAEDEKYDKYKVLQMIVNNTAGTLFMHESFHVDDSTKYSRSWFAWANSYFSIFANCLEQFISMNDVERIVNDAIKIGNVSYMRKSNS
eukprot:231686_1